MNSTVTENSPSSFDISYTIAALLTASCHGVGLCLMYHIDFKPVIQRIIIINLALTELLCCLVQAGLYIENLIDTDGWGQYPVTATMYLASMTFAFTSHKLVMLYLISDRFSDIFLNLRYAIYFTRRKVVRILSSLWVLSVCYGTVMGVCGALRINGGVLNNLRGLYYIHNLISVALDGTITIWAIITYVYFFVTVHKMAKADKMLQRMNNKQTRANLCLKFLLPFSMVANFLIFNVGSTITFEVAWESKAGKRDLLGRWAMFMLISGFLLDSILYVFLQRRIRDFLRSKMTRVLPIQSMSSTIALELTAM